MALKLRRGLSSDRTTITPAEGELLYTTDTKIVYVGDGSTLGGNAVSGGGGTGSPYSLSPLTAAAGSASIRLKTDDNSVISDLTLVGTLGNTISVVDANNISIRGGINTGGIGQIPFYLAEGQELTASGAALTWNRTTGQLLVGDNDFTGQVRVYSLAGGQASFVAGSWHNSATNVNNMQLQRGRGTGATPLAVQDGDRIYDIRFSAWDGAVNQASAIVRGEVNGTVTSGRVPGRLRFLTTSATGVISTALLIDSAQDSTFNGHITLNAEKNLRFADADSSNYLAFKAPSTVSTNVIWTLPATDGGLGQVLTTNGTGTLSWSTPSGGSSSSRTTVSAPTGVIANGATADVTIAGYKGYVLYKIETTAAAWVRIYTDIPSRTTDSSRVEGSDPLPGSGVIAEVITTGAQTVLISPGAIGFNGESTPSSNIYLAVTNKSGGSATITVTLTVLQIEV